MYVPRLAKAFRPEDFERIFKDGQTLSLFGDEELVGIRLTWLPQKKLFRVEERGELLGGWERPQ